MKVMVECFWMAKHGYQRDGNFKGCVFSLFNTIYIFGHTKDIGIFMSVYSPGA